VSLTPEDVRNATFGAVKPGALGYDTHEVDVLRGRLEDTLAAVTQAAAEELSDWAEELSESELRALRDPRNWVRPVVAVGAGGAAAGALVVLELRRRGRQQAKGGMRSIAGRVKP